LGGIKEEHHASKTNTPSGTAADTAVQLSAVLFGGAGKVLRITHEVFVNDAFGPGILAGLRHVASAPLGMLRGVGYAFRAASM
jgi:dihydrodipicolinate reductase